MEETLLGVYGADGWGGAAKERIKLQSELDRARDQVLLSSPPVLLSCCALHSVLCSSSGLLQSLFLCLSCAWLYLPLRLLALWGSKPQL